MLNKIPITVAVPVKNEETNLAECLSRLSLFQHIVVIDSASTDKTAQIAREFGAEVIDFVWNGQYPKKRNWFLIHKPPQTDWVLFLDADEFVDEKFCFEVATAIQSREYSAYWLNYDNFFRQSRLAYGVPQRKLALFKVGAALYEKIDDGVLRNLDMEIHEHPIVDGEIGEISAPIEHRDYRGLDHFLIKHVEYAKWEAARFIQIRDKMHSFGDFTFRQKFKYRYLDKLWFPPFYFFYSFIIRRGFLDGMPGLAYAFYKFWYFISIRLMIEENKRVVAS